jgi:hypothetical protein
MTLTHKSLILSMFAILRVYMNEGAEVGDCLDNRGPHIVVTAHQYRRTSASSQMQKVCCQKNVHQFLLVAHHATRDVRMILRYGALSGSKELPQLCKEARLYIAPRVVGELRAEANG